MHRLLLWGRYMVMGLVPRRWRGVHEAEDQIAWHNMPADWKEPPAD